MKFNPMLTVFLFRFLVSAGKDRALCVFQKSIGNAAVPYNLSANVKNAHKRIVWDCRFVIISFHINVYNNN